MLGSSDGGLAYIDSTITVAGWVKSIRQNRFIQMSDGSYAKDLQIVLDKEKTMGMEGVKSCGGTGACLEVVGKVVKSMGKGQTVEVLATRCAYMAVTWTVRSSYGKTRP